MKRRARWWAAALLFAGAAGAALLQARSGESGSGWVTRQIQGLLSGPGRTVEIGRISPSWNLDVTIHDLAVADDSGVWLKVDRAELDWAPGTLFRREFRINGLDVGRMVVERLPAGEPAPPPGDGPFSLPRLPDLPVGLDLRKLSVTRLELAAPVLAGEAAALSVAGGVRLDRAQAVLAADLDVDRLDRPGAGKLALSYAPDAGGFDLDLTVEEPQGGMIARAAGIPGLPPVVLALRGSGPLSGWRGRLDGTAGDTVRVRADAALRDRTAAEGGAGRDGRDYGLTISGDAAFARLLDRRTAALVGDSVTLEAEATINPNRRIALTGARMTMAAGTLELSGVHRFDRREFELDYALEANAGSSLLTLAPGTGWKELRLSGKVAGPARDRVRSPVAVTLNGGLTGLTTADPRIARLAGPEMRISGSAVIDPGLGEIRVEGLRVDAAAGSVTATALVRRGRAAPVHADFAATATGLRTGRPWADALAGRDMNLAGLVTVGTDGSIDLSRLTIEGLHGTLTVSATLRDNSLNAKWRASLPRLDVLTEPLDLPMAGSSVLEGTATGPLDALEVRADLAGRDLILSGRAVPRADLAVRAILAPGAPRGTVEATALMDRQPLDARAAFALEAQRLGLTGISLGIGRNRITGAVGVALDRMTAAGRLAGDLGDLGALSALAGRTLGGSGRIDIGLDDSQGRQAVTAAVQARNLSVAGPGGSALTAGRLGLNADVRDALGAMRFDAKLAGSGLAVAGADLGSLTASASGTPDKVRFQARTGGQAGAPLRSVRVRLAGGLTRDGAVRRLGLDTLDGAYAGQPFRLVGPATAIFGPDIIEIQGLRLASGKSRIALDARLAGDSLKGTATLTRVPLALASLAVPDLGLDGRLDGKAVVGGTISDPCADLDLRIADMGLGSGGAAGLTGIDLRATGRWRNGRLALDGNAAARRRDGAGLRFQADVPLVLRREPLSVELPRDAPVSAALRGHVELATLNDLFATTGDQARGRLDVNLDLRGSLRDPRLGGEAGIADGRYENQAAGTVISGIALRLRGDGRRLSIDRFTGRTEDGGTIKVSGSVNVDPADPGAFDMRVEARDAQLVQTDLVTARIDALLNLTGPLDAPLLRGPVTIRRADIRIPERMPSGVVEIQVEEINRPEGPVPADRQAAGAGAVRLRLDLGVTARNGIFVRGRGLNAEMSSELTVGGTAAKPILDGGLRLVNGTLYLLTTWFEFTRADVDFAGDGGTDPVLYISAQARAADIMARVVATGRASAPRITLTSTPEMPEDEIFARVLFNRPFGSLTAIEAVLIAHSISRLAGVGGTPGIVGKVRGALGIDRLELVGSDDGQGLSGTAVAAGRNVSRDVYVGAEQRVGKPGSRAVVEITLTGNLRLRTDVGTHSGANIGLLYEWEY